MHIDLDLKITLTGDAQDNQTKLAHTMINLTSLLAPSTSAQVSFRLHQPPSTPVVTPNIVRVTDLPAITVAPAPEPAPELVTVADVLAEASAPPAQPVEDEPAEATASPLPWAEYDRLVRSELKRLSHPNGAMCGHTEWDLRRDRRLPTLQAVIVRYGCQNARELANKIGYLAPIRSRAEKAQ